MPPSASAPTSQERPDELAPASNASSTASFGTFMDVADDEKNRLYQKLLTKKSRFQDELAVITDRLEASKLTGAGVKCMFEMKYHEERIGMIERFEGLEATIEGLEATIEDLKKTNEGLKKTNEGLKKTNEGLEATVECLDTRVVRYEETIASLIERVTNLEQNRQSGVTSTTGSSSARGSITRSRNRSARP